MPVPSLVILIETEHNSRTPHVNYKQGTICVSCSQEAYQKDRVSLLPNTMLHELTSVRYRTCREGTFSRCEQEIWPEPPTRGRFDMLEGHKFFVRDFLVRCDSSL